MGGGLYLMTLKVTPKTFQNIPKGKTESSVSFSTFPGDNASVYRIASHLRIFQRYVGWNSKFKINPVNRFFLKLFL